MDDGTLKSMPHDGKNNAKGAVSTVYGVDIVLNHREGSRDGADEVATGQEVNYHAVIKIGRILSGIVEVYCVGFITVYTGTLLTRVGVLTAPGRLIFAIIIMCFAGVYSGYKAASALFDDVVSK